MGRSFKNISTLFGGVITFVFGIILLAACTQASTPIPDPTPTFTLEPSPSTTNTPTRSITTTVPTATTTPSPILRSSATDTPAAEARFSTRVMTYNIQLGAGVGELYKKGVYLDFNKTDIPAFIKIVRIADPDILGLQELQRWDKGNPPIVKRVAKELGMDYAISKKNFGQPVGLMTKYSILEAEDISHLTVRHGSLRARLKAPDGQMINVYIVHFNSLNRLADPFEVKTFIKGIEQYTQSEQSSEELHLLIGDMNFSPYNEPARYLENAGWVLVADTSISNIDQIWVLDSVDWSRKQLLRLENMPALNKSDHNPLAFEISVLSFHEIPQYTPFPPTPTQIADPNP